MGNIYQHKQETWDRAKCERMARHVAKDGMGTPYPFKGYIGSSASVPVAFGLQMYNGLVERGGGLYAGENFPFPKLARGFRIVHVVSWGWRIVKGAKP